MANDLEGRVRRYFDEVASTIDAVPGAAPRALVDVSQPEPSPGSWNRRTGVLAVACVVLVLVLGVIAATTRPWEPERAAIGDATIGNSSDDSPDDVAERWEIEVLGVEPLPGAVRVSVRLENTGNDAPLVIRTDVGLLAPGITDAVEGAAWMGCIGDPFTSTVVTSGALDTAASRVTDVFACGLQTVEIRSGASLTVEALVTGVEPGSYRFALTSFRTAPFDLPAPDPTDIGACGAVDPLEVLVSVLDRRIAGSPEPGPCGAVVSSILSSDEPPCWSTCVDGRRAVGYQVRGESEPVSTGQRHSVLVEWRTRAGQIVRTTETFDLADQAGAWSVSAWGQPVTELVTEPALQDVRDYLALLADGRYESAASLFGDDPADTVRLDRAVGPGAVAEQLRRWCGSEGTTCTAPQSTQVYPTIDGRGGTVVAVFDLPSGVETRTFIAWRGEGGLPQITGLPPRGRVESNASDGDVPCASPSAMAVVRADLDGDGAAEAVVLTGDRDTFTVELCDPASPIRPLTGLTTEQWGRPGGVPVLVAADVDGDGIDELVVGASSGDGSFQGSLYRLVDGRLVTNTSVARTPTVFSACADLVGPTLLTNYSVFGERQIDGVGLVSWNAQAQLPGGGGEPPVVGSTRADDWNVSTDSCPFSPGLPRPG